MFTNVDFVNSPYKHINNGGLSDDEKMPYNVDAITGATLTIEGPAVVTSIPLSVRELENRNDGLVRGVYKDSRGKYIYEGMDLYYLLHDMVDGDNGIILTNTAYSVVLKDSNRADVAKFTLEEVARAHLENRPIVLAYGIGTLDEQTVAPFVFDAANEREKSEGYVKKLSNDDGCLKLVYDLDEYGANKSYKKFTNVAYVYLCEETEPGFKHTGAEGGLYNGSRYTDYIITFRGAALGYEINLTVGQLEALVAYDDKGNLVPGGVGYSDFYSLANNAYWYVNEYEGLDLYKLLIYLGMDDAEAMGAALSRTTLVSFIAADGVASPESFSVDTLSYPDAFGYYNKNAVDMGDGSYAPTNADLVGTGYPVLLAYGVNNYPYTIMKGEDGYYSGLSNSGGPIRVVFGKTQYNHANGSNQVQYLQDVIVGDDLLTNTHRYTDNPDHSALSGNKLDITVTDEDGNVLMAQAVSVGDIEDILYHEGAARSEVMKAGVKDLYQVGTGGAFVTDIYEGVDLQYFLMEVLGLPGTNGTVTFSNGTEKITVNLDQIFQTGYNTDLARSGLPAILAFAKNGSPMVPGADSKGYIDEILFNPLLASEPGSYRVDNTGGPLAVLIPSTDPDSCTAQSVLNVTSIEIELIPDAYAHIDAPYNSLANNTVRFYGEGLEQQATYSVGDIEGMQTKVKTLDYSMMNNAGTITEERYRGMAVYELFTQIGMKSNAGEVIVYAADGTSYTFPLSVLKKQTYINYLSPEKQNVFAMLAYGTGLVGEDTMIGLPLVRASTAAGYDAAYRNDGGPLKLIIPQESADSANAALCVKDVVAIEVTANEMDTWGHRMSDVYEEFLDYEFTFTVRNDDSEWSYVFTLAQLEAMTDLIVRDTYSVLDIGECEGIVIWKFIQRFAGDVPGIGDPVAVTVYAEDGYKNDLLSVFYKEGLEFGVMSEDGDRKPLIIAYAVNGIPLVDSESHEGYTGLAGNMGGPLRVVAETTQGASVKYVNKLVVTIPGSGPIDITVDESSLG